MYRISDREALKWTANGKVFVAKFDLCDTPSYNPRDSYDDDGMICFHSRYTLGDPHGYQDSEQLFQDLVNKFVPRYFLTNLAKEGKLNGIELRRNEEDPDLWDVWESGFVPDQKESYLWYERIPLEVVGSYIVDDITEEDCVKLLKDYCVIVPLWLYDHSGISMSCGARTYPYNDVWDSGCVGFYYLSKDWIKENLSANETDWESIGEEYIRSAVKEYDYFLCGDEWGFFLYEESEGELDEIDSCAGFLGDELEENGMLNYLPGLAEALRTNQYEAGIVKEVVDAMHSEFVA